MLREVLIGLPFVVVLAYILDILFARLDNPREPRRVSPAIPVIGHVVGFLYHGFDYYEILSRRTNAEVYTIGVLNFKVYVCQTTRLTNAIQRARTLSTKPFLRNENKIHSAVSDGAHALFDGEVLEAFRLRTKKALAPGPSLDSLSSRVAEEALREVSRLLEQDEFDLLAWTRHVVVQVTSRTLFGDQHPFRDAAIVDAMWTWEDYRPSHQVGLDLWHVGHKARAKVCRAFQEYLLTLPDDASQMIRERQEVLRNAGMDEEDIAKMQAFFSDAYYNIVPTLFWTIYEVYSRPQLLRDIRDEIASKATIVVQQESSSSSPLTPKGSGDADEEKGGALTLDVAALKTKCAILLSTYQETQRRRHEPATSRIVAEDTLLDGRYLLKRGRWFQMPVQPVHASRDIWGSDANVFNPYRFVDTPESETEIGDAKKKTKKVQPNAFLPWGAPPYTCPARQFVSIEVMAVVALLVMQADLAPVGGQDWERDPATRRFEKATLARPKKDVRVKLALREGAGKWDVVLGRSLARIPLASG